MNSHLVVELLLRVFRLVAGHHFHAWYVPECFSHAPVQTITHMARASCAIVHVWQKGAEVTW